MITTNQADPIRSRCDRALRLRCWEYLVQATDWPLEAEELDRLGERGWRLAAAIRDGGLIVHYFTRPDAETSS
jgi:hypothetical protein